MEAVDEACQTSLAPPESLQITKFDLEDDRVIEAIVTGSEQKLEPPKMLDDELDLGTKLASRHMVSELKSVLPLQVTAEARQERKRQLFPEFWEKCEIESDSKRDIILPEANSFSFDQSEVSIGDEEDGDRTPLIFPDEREKREGRENRENHAFCCSSNQTSLAQLIAKQVVAKAKTTSAQEYLYDVSDSD